MESGKIIYRNLLTRYELKNTSDSATTRQVGVFPPVLFRILYISVQLCCPHFH